MTFAAAIALAASSMAAKPKPPLKKPLFLPLERRP